ncbi:hypothetical protein N9N26_03280 [Candidatus Poseidoniales archaeon]|nr:hypothetical protein [Candidatus Poseidoniales archaeon]MDB2624105.1 hypothetical protein [Candidatus Poseidoniales archaeon]
MDDVRTWLEGTKKGGMALGLAHTKSVLERLHLSHTPEHVLHVAGSNGKGTACALMAGSLTLNGVSNLLFSSPHLIRVEERIRINGVPISYTHFEAALGAVRDAAAEEPMVSLTFFEATYLAAMQCASDVGVTVLILETGLGGRKDATRSGPATACLITSVSAEHRDILGDSLPQIAKEKAAISRPNCPILIRHPMNSDVQQAMLDEVQSAGQTALGEQLSPAVPTLIEIPPWASVRDEARILANSLLEKVGLPTSAMDEAFEQVRWPARMQGIESSITSPHPFVLDAAHNPSGLKRVLPELEQVIAASNQTKPFGWTLVFGTSPQRDLAAFCQPLIDLCLRHPPHQLIITEPQGGRYPAVSATTIASLDWPCESVRVEPKPSKAIHHLTESQPHNVGLVVSLGSLYLQGNILNVLGRSSDEDLSLLAKQ